MTDEQYEQFRRELNTPYSDEELELHLKDREFKGMLEITHYDNLSLIKMANGWIAYVNGKGPRPKRNIWSYLVPGRNGTNSACDRLNRIVDEFSAKEYRSIPPIPIAFICSRSTLKLVSCLSELYHTPHLDTAESAAKDFFYIITNESNHDYTQKQLRKVLTECLDRFVSACEANAKELHTYLLDFIRGHKPSKPATCEQIKNILKPIQTKQDVALASITDTNKIVKRIDNRERKALRRKRHRYTSDQLNSIHLLWLKAEEDPNVRLCSSRRPSIEAALKYFKKEFNALDVYSADDLRKALKAWSKHAGTRSVKK